MKLLVACFVLLYVRPTSTAANVKQPSKPPTITDRQLPDFIQLKFTAKGRPVRLNLTRSTSVDEGLPDGNLTVVFGERGRVRQWNNTAANTSHYEYAVYKDTINTASIVRVFCQISLRITYMGTFNLNGTLYALKQYGNKRMSQLPYTGQFMDVVIEGDAYRMLPVTTKLNYDDSNMHNGRSTKTNPGTRHRRGRSSSRTKRQAAQANYFVNMLIVVDYAIYYRWYTESMATTAQAKRADAMQNVIYYYNTIITGVNMRYASIVQPDLSISVRFAGIYVATTPTDSQFTEGPDVKIGMNYVDTYTALVKFSSFVAGTLRPTISFDQATLFTGNQLLVRYTDGSNSTISGLAYIQGICSNYSVSVNYEAGEYSSIQTAAHELGHNLGAQHDGLASSTGVGNICSSADQYLMATGPQYLTAGIFNHPFQFSSCSVDYFRNYLSASTASCLFDNFGSSNTTSTLPSGQRYNADKQCQIIYGPQSFYCAGGSRDQSICREMQCWVPEIGECFAKLEQRAFDGTTCGNHMWCMWGTCVHDDLAPASADSCVYGNYRDVFSLSATLDMNCSMIGVNQPFRCYDPAYSMDCCQTCSAIRNNANPGCEYGNNDWLGTCKTINRQDCYDPTVLARCCSTCGKMANPAAVGCHFGDRAQWCATQPSYNCYSVAQTCCGTCQQYYTAVTGCEYGDRAGWCQGYADLDCKDPYYADQCCGTCMSKSSSTAQPITTSTTPRSVTSTVSRNGVNSTITLPITTAASTIVKTTTLLTLPRTTTASQITTLGTTSTVASTRSQTSTTSSVSMSTTTAVTSTNPNSTCPLGDGASFCSTILPIECYNYGQLCCSTCQKYYTGVQGCEYGDQVGWCATYVQGPSECSRPEVATYCCQTCAAIKQTTSAPACTDKASWCSGMFPGYCYDSSVASTCCAECARVSTKNSNCQYGDRFSWCQAQYCSQNAAECCASCK